MKPTNPQKPPAIFLMGPTASGKTALAMQLYQQFPVELISVDSALVYRGLNIGTAKPSPAELTATPHQLIDIRAIPDTYSVENFRRDALEAMADITARGHIPLLVGGTMLYFRALQQGLSPLPAADPEIRTKLQDRLQTIGLDALRAELSHVDPQTAARVQDTQRIIRALEVWQKTGKPLSELQAQKGEAMPYRVLKMVCAPTTRHLLHQRIQQRFAQMLASGFEEEVAKLMINPALHAELPALRSVGYRQMWAYLQGHYHRPEMIARSEAATRQLAKRQLTWLRSEPAIHWLPESEQLSMALQLTSQFIF
jgi:tRNA dimethylallyltransferase